MTKETLKAIRDARSVSEPLLVISTADPIAAVLALADEYDPAKNPAAKSVTPIVSWDLVRGFQPANDAGADVIAAIKPPADEVLGPAVDASAQPLEALKMAYRAPERTIFCFLNAHKLLTDPGCIQGISNLRDPFKGSRRTWIGLGPSFQLPAELSQDVSAIDDALPTETELTAIVRGEVERHAEAVADGRVKMPAGWAPADERAIVDGAASMAGLARFPAEQTIAQSLRETGTVSQPVIWARKRSYVGQTQGLTMEAIRETMADVIGLDAIARKLDRRFKGKDAPVVTVRLEELEKVLGGAKSDSSGVSQDALSVWLTAMEETEWEGLIGFGVPGSGKSLISRAVGGQFGRPVITCDMGAMKGSLVGQSEQAVRAAIKTIKAIAGPRAYFIASCNGTATIPAALLRRFTDGIWFFDLPSAEALAGVWALYRAKYQIDANDPTPAVNGWTPAEVRNCCRTAYREGLTLREASAFVMPVSRTDKDGIAAMRKQAHGAFIDASTGRPYVDPLQASGTAPALATLRDRSYGEGL
jgi:hypothetical protein